MVNRVLRVALCALALAAAPLAAQAPPTPVGSACNAPADIFGGSGIPTDNAFCTTYGQTTLVLSFTQRYESPAVTTDGAGTYFAQTGESVGAPNNTGFAQWNVDYAILGGSSRSFYALILDLDPGSGVTPFTTFLSATGHDSFNYGYLGSLLFDPFKPATYTAVLGEMNGMDPSDLLHEVRANIVVGDAGPVTATPEPASIALMATGLVGVGLFVRRRKHKQSAVSAALAAA
jgi:hypothetical protein